MKFNFEAYVVKIWLNLMLPVKDVEKFRTKILACSK